MPFTSSYVLLFVLPVIVAIVAGAILRRLTTLNWKWTLLLALGLCLLAAALVYFLAPHEVADNVVSGTVRDETTQEAISGAFVNILGRQESQKTDSSGNFRLNLVMPFPEIVRLHVAAPGHSDKEFDIRPPQHSLSVQLQRIPK